MKQRSDKEDSDRQNQMKSDKIIWTAFKDAQKVLTKDNVFVKTTRKEAKADRSCGTFYYNIRRALTALNLQERMLCRKKFDDGGRKYIIMPSRVDYMFYNVFVSVIRP